MKKLLLFLLCVLFSGTVLGWGSKGHDVIASIAERHLTPSAAAHIDSLLGGHSLVYYANWMDVASHTPEYDYTRTWHYFNVDKDMTVTTMPRNPQGDVLEAVELLIAKLQAGNLDPIDEAIYLKMLIHFVGDLHCPMHLGRLNDLGGNKRNVSFFKRPSNLHSVWDTALVEAAHSWSYSEWCVQIDRVNQAQMDEITAGQPLDWIEQTHKICVDVYANSPTGINISYEYLERAGVVIEQQLLRGGYRLANLLNKIYSTPSDRK